LSAKLVIAIRVHAPWSSHNCRIASWNTTALADSVGGGLAEPDATAVRPDAIAAAATAAIDTPAIRDLADLRDFVLVLIMLNLLS
jgi:hypothetical protein